LTGFLRQIRVESGVPGKATVRQSAKAQSVLGMVPVMVRWPTLFSCEMVVSVALVVSRLAGVRPPPGSGRVCVVGETKRAKVGPVIDEPSGFLATGTRIVSAATFGSALNTRSPCQPLAT